MMKKMKISVGNIMPIAMLLLLVLIFAVATGGQLLSSNNMNAIINQSVAIIIAGLGMIFVVSFGGTDITAGSLAAVAGTFAAMAGKNVGFWAVFPVAILVGLISGSILGIVNTRFKVSSFMTSLSMLIALRALVNWILDASTILATKEIRYLNEPYVKLIFLIVSFLIIGYIFNFTPFGYYCRGIGENENAMKYIGINIGHIKLFAFIISGIMAGIAGVFAIARNGGASNTMCASFEMKIMMAMFIASIPVSGGFATHLYKLLIGTLTIQILESGLSLVGASGAITQMVRGCVLIAVVYLTQVLKTKSDEGKILTDRKNISL